MQKGFCCILHSLFYGEVGSGAGGFLSFSFLNLLHISEPRKEDRFCPED